jgi:polyisoprenoid-binding protein YceI
MKFLAGAGLLSVVVASCPDHSVAATAPSQSIDTNHTQISFEVNSIGFGKTHGNFRRFDGKISLDLERPQRSSVDFTVSAASVATGSQQFDDYIRDTFFDVSHYPRMNFRSTYVRKIDAHTAEVGGDLDLHGVTQPVVLNVSVEHAQDDRRKFAFVATTTIRRSEFGMTAATPIVADEVAIQVSTEAHGPE